MQSWEIVFKLGPVDAELRRLLTEVDAYRLSIQKLPLPPSLRGEISRLNIIRAIHGTIALEGNTLTEDQVGRLVDSTDRTSSTVRSRDEREVANADAVRRYVEWQASSPGADGAITQDSVRHVHRVTTEGIDIDYEANDPGFYRTQGARAGDYLCPSPERIESLMERFVEFSGSVAAREAHPVMRALTAHFHLVSIHPFGDGNGRASRAIEAYVLLCAGYGVAGFYSLANFYYRNRAEYVAGLQDARFRHDGDISEFARFALRGYLEELQTLQEEIVDGYRLILYKDTVREMAESGRLNPREQELLGYLTRGEVKDVRVEDVGTLRDPIFKAVYGRVSRASLYRDLKHLKGAGLLVEKDGLLTPRLGAVDSTDSGASTSP